MQVKIRETGKIEELRYYRPNNNSEILGPDIAQDFIWGSGTLDDGSCDENGALLFEYNDDEEIYECSMETFRWWTNELFRRGLLDDRIAELSDEHGSECINDTVEQAIDGVDFDEQVARANAALDAI